LFFLTTTIIIPWEKEEKKTKGKLMIASAA
jgi:hypothetical protein